MDKKETTCTKCNLYKNTTNVKIPSTIPENGKVDMFFCGEGPGFSEEEQGKPFVGPAGDNLDTAFKLAGIKREEVGIGNICKCRPVVIKRDGTRQNRAPTKIEMKACYPYLLKELQEYKPKVIVCLGLTATKMILRDATIKMREAHGRAYNGKTVVGFDCYIIPTWHPSPTTFINNQNRMTQMFNDITTAKQLVTREIVEKDWVSIIVVNYETWKLVFEILKNADGITYDLETTGLDFNAPDAKITNIGLTSANGYGISVITDGGNWTPESFSLFLKDIEWLMENKPIDGHYITFDSKYMKKMWNIWPKIWGWDTALGHAVIKPGDSNRLKDIIRDYVSSMGGYETVLSQYGGLMEANPMERGEYNIGDVVATNRIKTIQKKKIIEQKKMFLMKEIVLPAANFMAEIEYRGVKIDKYTLNQLKLEYSKKLREIKNNMYLHGTIMKFNMESQPFNPNSSQQIAKVLFDKKYCGYKPVKFTKKRQAPAADQEVLKTIVRDHNSDLCKMLLEHSKISKLYSTYLEGLENKIINNRVHTTYHLDISRSGRLSSRDPNLQNIPGDSNIKSMFVADDGFAFVDLDYRQMELVVSTYYTKDPIMMEAVKSGDAHSYIAKLIFDISEVTKENRVFIKTLNFGVLYGMGAKLLSHELHIKEQEARELIDAYFDLMKETYEWVKSKRRHAKTHGFVASKFGRMRYYDRSNEKETYNSAVNHPIQSLASDIMLYAMRMWKKYLVSREIYGKDAYMSLQVHDSVTTSVREDLVKELIVIKKKIFESVTFDFMCLPLTTDIGVGYNWGNINEVKI